MSEALHWTEYFRAVGPTLIAVFVTYIAYQQWQINRASLRERLFDRRFSVFNKTQIFLSSIMEHAKVEDEALGEFYDAPQMAKFLFDSKLSEYLELLRNRALNMRLHALKAKEPRNETERLASVEANHEELKWLYSQLVEIFDRFEPYLGFKKHK